MGLELLIDSENTKGSNNSAIFTTSSTSDSSSFITEIIPLPNNYTIFHDTGSMELTPKLPLTSSLESVDSINIKLENIFNTHEMKRFMKVLDLQKYLHSIYSKIDHVIAVYLSDHIDYLEINTIIDTKDRVVRNNIFQNQLILHDKFPELSFDFKIIIKNHETLEELEPDRASICYKK